MAEPIVAELMKKLELTEPQAQALWLATCQSAFKVLSEGQPIDLGFAYATPAKKKPRRRYDFGTKATVSSPARSTIKLVLPPHILNVLDGRETLNPHVWLSRVEFKQMLRKNLAPVSGDEASGYYYNLKGVTG